MQGIEGDRKSQINMNIIDNNKVAYLFWRLRIEDIHCHHPDEWQSYMMHINQLIQCYLTMYTYSSGG